jgi:hypothetical protein
MKAKCQEKVMGMRGCYRPCKSNAREGGQYCAVHALKYEAKDMPVVTWYKISKHDDKIEERQFVGDTERQLITARGDRVAKHDSYSSYFRSRDLAHAALVDRAKAEIESAQRSLARAQDRLAGLVGELAEQTARLEKRA